MTNYLLSLLPSPRKSEPSIDQLRAAYTDLLKHIDVDNDILGDRRGIGIEDLECLKRSTRFSFRKNIVPSKDSATTNATTTTTTTVDAETPFNTTTPGARDSLIDSHYPMGNDSYKNTKVDLATAFRLLAATKSPDKEGEDHGATPIRDDSSMCGIERAKALEGRVCDLIQKIGNIVVHAGEKDHQTSGPGGFKANHAMEKTSSVRTDPVFEYFCEKCVLSLFVDVVKEVRQGSNQQDVMHPSEKRTCVSVHGVVWSASVKAQVYETVSLLVNGARNRTMLYYLLSNNYINQLINSILPLRQWTEPAITKMLPAYVDLLKNVTLQLADDPNLFPFLTIEDGGDDDEEEEALDIEFPLFKAALETATSVYAQSDSQLYATCLAIIVNLMHVPHPPIQQWISHSSPSQRLLADHLCQRLLDRYRRMNNITRGPIVDGARHNAIASQLIGLKDEMGMVHEIFWSGVRGLDVRLCESLLQKVVSVLLRSLSQSPPARSFLTVGLIDLDVIPEQEANAQVATVFFSYMFSNLVYIPFQRMLSVALFHPKSTPIWSLSNIHGSLDASDDYIFMPVLSDIVNDEESRETCPNQFRDEMLKTLKGEYGEWRTAAAACLLQSVLKAEENELNTTMLSGVISGEVSDSSSIYDALSAFFARSHKPTEVSARALECMGHLGLLILHRIVTKAFLSRGSEDIRKVLSQSPVWKALTGARHYFCKKAMEYRHMTGVSDIFLDLTEAVIKTRYTGRYTESGSATFTCHLSRRGSFQTMMDANFLVRGSRSVTANDVEKARFYINMGIHFRALCNVIERFCQDFESAENESSSSSSSSSAASQSMAQLDLGDVADTLTRTIGGLSDKRTVGEELDLTGRMFFKFQSFVNPDMAHNLEGAIVRESPEGSSGAKLSKSHLILVLDPTDILIVKPMVQKMEGNRGTVLGGISLRNIIAAAVDGAWLHIAIRNTETLKTPILIKNGNMALQFESPGTCLIVKQYLDRSREVLRQDLLSKVPALLTHDMEP